MTDDGIVVASKTPPGHRCGWCGGASKSGYVYHFKNQGVDFGAFCSRDCAEAEYRTRCAIDTDEASGR